MAAAFFPNSNGLRREEALERQANQVVATMVEAAGLGRSGGAIAEARCGQRERRRKRCRGCAQGWGEDDYPKGGIRPRAWAAGGRRPRWELGHARILSWSLQKSNL